MPDMGAGPRIYKYATGVATLTVTPVVNYSAVVRRVLIDKVSANDTWLFTIAGQEVARFIINTTGHQQLLSAATGAFPSDNDLFAFCENVLDDPLTFSLQQGQTLTINSLAGATADISVAYEEFPGGVIGAGRVNSQSGNTYYVPMYFYLNAAQSALGERQIDTQGGLSFVPAIFTGGTFPQGWQVDIVGLFLEGAGVNTFSGAANHQSITNYLSIIKNGQRLYTRDAAAGIPLVGTASAAGSANVVLGADYTPYPPFQDMSEQNWRPFDPPLSIRPGDTTLFALNLTGDVTGGASYATALQVALCKIREG